MKPAAGPLIARIILFAPVLLIILAIAGYGIYSGVQAIAEIAPKPMRKAK